MHPSFDTAALPRYDSLRAAVNKAHSREGTRTPSRNRQRGPIPAFGARRATVQSGLRRVWGMICPRRGFHGSPRLPARRHRVAEEKDMPILGGAGQALHRRPAMSRTRHHGVDRRPFSSPRCGRRRGYAARQDGIARLYDDCLDLGISAGKAMRRTRDWMVQRDWELYRAGELDCLQGACGVRATRRACRASAGLGDRGSSPCGPDLVVRSDLPRGVAVARRTLTAKAVVRSHAGQPVRFALDKRRALGMMPRHVEVESRTPTPAKAGAARLRRPEWCARLGGAETQHE